MMRNKLLFVFHVPWSLLPLYHVAAVRTSSSFLFFHVHGQAEGEIALLQAARAMESAKFSRIVPHVWLGTRSQKGASCRTDKNHTIFEGLWFPSTEMVHNFTSEARINYFLKMMVITRALIWQPKSLLRALCLYRTHNFELIKKLATLAYQIWFYSRGALSSLDSLSLPYSMYSNRRALCVV